MYIHIHISQITMDFYLFIPCRPLPLTLFNATRYSNEITPEQREHKGLTCLF